MRISRKWRNRWRRWLTPVLRPIVRPLCHDLKTATHIVGFGPPGVQFETWHALDFPVYNTVKWEEIHGLVHALTWMIEQHARGQYGPTFRAGDPPRGDLS